MIRSWLHFNTQLPCEIMSAVVKKCEKFHTLNIPAKEIHWLSNSEKGGRASYVSENDLHA